jgi:hypothetical protein
VRYWKFGSNPNKAERRVKDLSALDAVKIKIGLKYPDGSIISLPVFPKIKDEKGNVYCELDNKGERRLIVVKLIGTRVKEQAVITAACSYCAPSVTYIISQILTYLQDFKSLEITLGGHKLTKIMEPK